ncbi:MAG: HlyD family type I secretion periplasmic adaptor subunit, partial [Arenimonas sp.]
MKHVFQAWSDFATRYLTVFRSVWEIRAQLDPKPRNEDELAFLPAQLELVETPVSPAPRIAIRLIVLLFFIALLWSVFGKLDIDAVAPGKTVASDRTKVIQPLEVAVIKSIRVKDGQLVHAGDLLIELDPAGTAADEHKANEASSSAQGQAARYRALSTALDRGVAPSAFSFETNDVANVKLENSLAQSEYQTFNAKQQATTSAIAQKQAELATTKELIISLKETARIAKERTSGLEPLLAKQYISRLDFLAAQQAQIEAERNLGFQINRTLELQAGISALKSEQSSQISDFRRQVMNGLRTASDQMAQTSQDVNKTKRRNELMQIRAPVTGTVQQLATHTVGGVVTPAQPLLAIVPEDSSLDIEALVLNRDIGFVREGQNAVIK